jgi:hypothetical protein
MFIYPLFSKQRVHLVIIKLDILKNIFNNHKLLFICFLYL